MKPTFTRRSPQKIKPIKMVNEMDISSEFKHDVESKNFEREDEQDIIKTSNQNSNEHSRTYLNAINTSLNNSN